MPLRDPAAAAAARLGEVLLGGLGRRVERGWRVLDGHQQHLHRREARKGRVPVRELQDRDPERPDVRQRVIPARASGRLGPARRAQEQTGGGGPQCERHASQAGADAAGAAHPVVCSMTSGAIQHGVPTNVLRAMFWLPHEPPRSMVAATPKSASITWPLASIRMLPACAHGRQGLSAPAPAPPAPAGSARPLPLGRRGVQPGAEALGARPGPSRAFTSRWMLPCRCT